MRSNRAVSTAGQVWTGVRARAHGLGGYALRSMLPLTRSLFKLHCSQARSISSTSFARSFLGSIFGSGSGSGSGGGGASSSSSSNDSGSSGSSGSSSSGSAIANARALSATPAEEQSIKDALSAVLEPVTGKSLLQLGSLQRIVVSSRAAGADGDGTKMTIFLDLLVPGHPRWAGLTTAVRRALQASTVVRNVQFTFVDECAAATTARGLNTALPGMYMYV